MSKTTCPIHTPANQLDTPYVRLSQCLTDHRVALTGADVQAQHNAMCALMDMIVEEWQQTLDALLALQQR